MENKIIQRRNFKCIEYPDVNVTVRSNMVSLQQDGDVIVIDLETAGKIGAMLVVAKSEQGFRQ